MVWVAIGRDLINPRGIACSVALVAVLLIAGSRLPFHWLDFWEHRHPILRGLGLAGPGYTLLVTLGNMNEIYSFRLWKEFVLPIGGSPFTSVHAAALSASVYLFATQIYFLVTPLPEDAERIVQGQAFISFDEAVRRAQVLFQNK